MKSVAVLQARTTSARLPGKVLLPINDLPIAVLAALRAGNTGRRIIVATSNQASDDALAAIILRHNLSLFRGSLENVLERVVGALTDHDDNTLVFRLTADNVFPDGHLLDEMEQDFLRRNVEYLSSNGEPSGLPYGVSVELTRLRHLREALRLSGDRYDQEHVTPYIVRKFGASFFENYFPLGAARFRATIDNIDDYASISSVFADVADPIHATVGELIDRLQQAPFQPTVPTPVHRLVLGTAQLGGDYGIANRTGRPGQKLCEQLLKTAIANGVPLIDTARTYGASEEIIGSALKGWEGRARIVTKLSPLCEYPAGLSETAVNALVDASVYHSCSCLRARNLDVVLLHRAAHLDAWRGGAWRRLKELRAAGVITDLGVSVQEPLEAERALKEEGVTFIQIPFNILDWRWDNVISKVVSIKKERELSVHARSPLLQGLLTSDDSHLWARANVGNPQKVIKWLRQQTEVCDRRNTVDLCIQYVNSHRWIDGVVVGVETMRQLEEDLDFFCGPVLNEAEVANIVATRPLLADSTLNPRLWRKA